MIDLDQNLVQTPPGFTVSLKALTRSVANPFLFPLLVAEISKIGAPLLDDAAALPTSFLPGFSVSKILPSGVQSVLRWLYPIPGTSA
jgi:hypothetical protein